MTGSTGPSRRLAYLGSPDFAVAPLRALVAAGHDVAVVVSRADARRGRGGALSPSPVKAAAIELGLDTADDPAAAGECGAELGVVVAYGRILRSDLLARLPFVNLHFSLLPRWRGAAPVERAILAGDEVTGVCLMAVEEGLDTGGVYARAEVPVGDASLDELRATLVDRGTALLLDALANGLGEPVPQDGEVTYAYKIDRAERVLDFARPAVEAWRRVRVGGAVTEVGGRRLKVIAARPLDTADPNLAPGVIDGTVVGCGDATALELVTVQPEGRAAMAATAWLAGARLAPGTRLGSGA